MPDPGYTFPIIDPNTISIAKADDVAAWAIAERIEYQNELIQTLVQLIDERFPLPVQ